MGIGHDNSHDGFLPERDMARAAATAEPLCERKQRLPWHTRGERRVYTVSKMGTTGSHDTRTGQVTCKMSKLYSTELPSSDMRVLKTSCTDVSGWSSAVCNSRDNEVRMGRYCTAAAVAHTWDIFHQPWPQTGGSAAEHRKRAERLQRIIHSRCAVLVAIWSDT